MTALRSMRITAPLILALLAGCSGRTGVVSGELVMVGGPADVGIPVAGTVLISGGDGPTTYSVATAADGAFTIDVPAGTYVVTGRSPRYQGGRWDCRIDEPSLTVHAGEAITVDVTCDMK